MKNESTNHQGGRFIKHNDPVTKHLTITEFNLMDVCEVKVTFPDNPLANIVHRKLHTISELQSSIKTLPSMDTEFDGKRLPVIHPLDFTEDWKRMRKRNSNPDYRDEDDELDADLNIFIKSQKRVEEKQVLAGDIELNIQSDNLVEKPENIKEETIEHSEQDKLENNFLDTHSLSPQNPEDDAKVANPSFNEQENNTFKPYFSTENLTPTNKNGPVEDDTESIRLAAEAEGYKKGFQIGEEKGSLASQEKTDNIVHELTKVIQEIEGMQRSILQRSQANFHTICQSLLEALLEKEFQINPESFEKIINRAIKEALTDDDFRITVNPTVFKNIKNTENHTFASKMKADEKLEKFQFKIEGKQGVLDTKLKDIIQNLLNQADLSLFDHKDSDEKVS